MPDVKPRFEPVINMGHILQTITIVSAVIAMMMKLSSWQVTTDLAIDRIEARSQKYIPMIESMNKSDDMQSERISNMAQFIAEQRQLNNQLLAGIGDLKADMAVVKTQMQRDNK